MRPRRIALIGGLVLVGTLSLYIGSFHLLYVWGKAYHIAVVSGSLQRTTVRYGGDWCLSLPRPAFDTDLLIGRFFGPLGHVEAALSTTTLDADHPHAQAVCEVLVAAARFTAGELRGGVPLSRIRAVTDRVHPLLPAALIAECHVVGDREQGWGVKVAGNWYFNDGASVTLNDWPLVSTTASMAASGP